MNINTPQSGDTGFVLTMDDDGGLGYLIKLNGPIENFTRGCIELVLSEIHVYDAHQNAVNSKVLLDQNEAKAREDCQRITGDTKHCLMHNSIISAWHERGEEVVVQAIHMAKDKGRYYPNFFVTVLADQNDKTKSGHILMSSFAGYTAFLGYSWDHMGFNPYAVSKLENSPTHRFPD